MNDFSPAQYNNQLLKAVNSMSEYMDKDCEIVIKARQMAFRPLMSLLEGVGLKYVVSNRPPYPDYDFDVVDFNRRAKAARIAMKVIKWDLIEKDLLSWDELKRYRAFVDPNYTRKH